MKSKDIGNLTELQCITNLYALGCGVSIPFGDNQKYDLIIDYKNKLYKIQVKHARDVIFDNKIVGFSINTRWQGHNSKGYIMHSYLKEDIDFFATYHKNNLFLIPIEECTSGGKVIRYNIPKNNQLLKINFAPNYLAKAVLERL